MQPLLDQKEAESSDGNQSDEPSADLSDGETDGNPF